MHYFVCLCMVLFSWGSFAEIYEFAVIGDAGHWNSKSQKVQASILKYGVNRLILPGDNNYNDSKENKKLPLVDRLSIYDREWVHWSGFSFDAMAIGNHNIGYDAELDYFNTLIPGGHSEYYTRVIGSQIRLIVLNSDNEKNVTEQISWFRDQLKNAEEKFIFIVYHHPSYTTHFAHPWTEKRQFQKGIRPLLKQYSKKITALLLGHDHMAAHVAFGSIKAFISGAVMDVRWGFPLNYIALDGTKVSTRFLNANHPHWLHLTVDDEAMTATARFISVKNDKVVYEHILK